MNIHRLKEKHAFEVATIQGDVDAIVRALKPLLAHEHGALAQDIAVDVQRRVHRIENKGRRACNLGRMISVKEAQDKQEQVLWEQQKQAAAVLIDLGA